MYTVQILSPSREKGPNLHQLTTHLTASNLHFCSTAFSNFCQRHSTFYEDNKPCSAGGRGTRMKEVVYDFRNSTASSLSKGQIRRPICPKCFVKTRSVPTSGDRLSVKELKKSSSSTEVLSWKAYLIEKPAVSNTLNQMTCPSQGVQEAGHSLMEWKASYSFIPFIFLQCSCWSRIKHQAS